jgi:hypothetical protein
MSQCGKKDIVKMYVVQPGGTSQIGVNVFSEGAFIASGVTTFNFIDTDVFISGANQVDIKPKDTFVTGGTYDNNTSLITFNKNDGSSFNVDLSSLSVDGTTVTGFTYDNINTLTISLSNGDTFSTTIQNLSATTISATTFYGDGSNLTGVVGEDNYVSGGTYNPTTQQLEFLGTNTATTFNVDLSSIVQVSGDTYVSGFTYNGSSNQLTISQNNNTNFPVYLSEMSGMTFNGDISFNDGNILNPNYIQFNTGYTGNTIVEGRMYWDEENQTVSLGLHGGDVSLQLGQEIHYLVKNQSGSTIENGRVVRAVGTLGSSGRILGEYMIADGTIPAKYTLGIATKDILDGDDGYVTEFGLVRGVNTTGSLYGETWNDGDILWVSPTIPGGLTNVEPLTPDLHIEMAIVIRAASNGSIFVRPHRYPYSYDLQDMGWSAGTENNLDVIQWDSSLGYFKLTNTPIFNSISAQTISATTFYGDGSNLTGVVGEDNYVSGGTYNPTTKEIEFVGTNSATTFNVDLSSITQPTGTTIGYSSYILTGGTFYEFSGGVNTVIVNKTVSSNTLINLPSSPEKDRIYVVTDRKGDSWKYPITVSGNTKYINGYPNIVIKIKNNPSLTFLYNGLEYIII